MKKSLGPATTLHPHPVLIVGSYDAEDRPNIMTAAWGGICCSKPPCVAISLRKSRKSYDNIMHHRCFTISIPSVRHVRAADFVGIVSGADVDKFAATGLTPVRSDVVHAPYVGEFPVVLECKVVAVNELGVHTQFVGEILDVKADEEVVGKGNLPDITKVEPFAYATGNRAYFAMGEKLQDAYVTRKM